MKYRKLITPLAALAFTGSAFAQITTSSFTTALDLANSLLADDSGITITSATYTGANDASGWFTATSGLLPFNSGIVLTNGSRLNVEGTNTSSGASTNNDLPGDAALSAITGGATFDASTLEIHFTPTNNVVSFQYVFGSEEYNEYVNSFNDVFAFFLNGTNIALLPSSSTAVSINNVNNAVNSQYYFDNASGALPTQLDGFVGRNAGFPLFATGAVNPGVDNVIRISVADALDHALDTAVFLKAGSFVDTAPPPVGSPVPEPSTYGLLGAAALGLAAIRRRKKNQ